MAMEPTFDSVTAHCNDLARRLGHDIGELRFNTQAGYGGPVTDLCVFFRDQMACGPYLTVIAALEDAVARGTSVTQAITEAGLRWQRHPSQPHQP
jgi:hypothetical protein